MAGRSTEASNPVAVPLFLTGGVWVGALVPKRWARRAVTRNLLKRQIYQVSKTQEHLLPHAAHLVRLRVEFDHARFVSAASGLLRQAAAEELRLLFRHAVIALASGAAA